MIAGAPLTFRFDVVNRGPSIAANTLISDTLPAGMGYLSGWKGCQPTIDLDLVIVDCTVGTMPVGGTASVEITVSTAPDSTGTFDNTAGVGSDALGAALMIAGSRRTRREHFPR